MYRSYTNRSSGIIRTVGKDESPEMITDTKELFDEYLHNERCIILAIVSANVEFHNSNILALAERVDPTTSHFIPGNYNTRPS